MFINMILIIKNPKNIETLSAILLFFRLFDANPWKKTMSRWLRVKFPSAVGLLIWRWNFSSWKYFEMLGVYYTYIPSFKICQLDQLNLQFYHFCHKNGCPNIWVISVTNTLTATGSTNHLDRKWKFQDNFFFLLKFPIRNALNPCKLAVQYARNTPGSICWYRPKEDSFVSRPPTLFT